MNDEQFSAKKRSYRAPYVREVVHMLLILTTHLLVRRAFGGRADWRIHLYATDTSHVNFLRLWCRLADFVVPAPHKLFQRY